MYWKNISFTLQTMTGLKFREGKKNCGLFQTIFNSFQNVEMTGTFAGKNPKEYWEKK